MTINESTTIHEDKQGKQAPVHLQFRNTSTMSAEPSASKASSSSGSRRKHRSGDGTKKKKSKRLDTPNEPDVAASAVALPSFGEDFVGFVASDDEDAEEPQKPAREWDVGKPSRADERDRGRRRDHEREDGYANKKERMNASSRRAPWVDDVAWEDCANVAEMCVSRRAGCWPDGG
jgi:non-canonical poly(A) RNA polymerase PAPD5/7